MAFPNLLEMSIVLIIIYSILSLIWLVVWILTLVHQAKRKRWVFFILTILFNIVLIIYWITWVISPKFRKKKT